MGALSLETESEKAFTLILTPNFKDRALQLKLEHFLGALRLSDETLLR